MSRSRLAQAAATLAIAGADALASCISIAVEAASSSVPPAPVHQTSLLHLFCKPMAFRVPTLLAAYALGACILHHAPGLQTERMVIAPSPIVKAAKSHMYALWPWALGLPICDVKYLAGCRGSSHASRGAPLFPCPSGRRVTSEWHASGLA